MALFASRWFHSACPRARSSRAPLCATTATAAASTHVLMSVFFVFFAFSCFVFSCLEIDEPRVLDDERSPERFVGVEVGGVAAIVVDDEQPGAAPVQHG